MSLGRRPLWTAFFKIETGAFCRGNPGAILEKVSVWSFKIYGRTSYCTATVYGGPCQKMVPTGPYFARRKTLSANCLYAFCRAKQGASTTTMQTKKEVRDIKSWRAQSMVICISSQNECDSWNFFLPQ